MIYDLIDVIHNLFTTVPPPTSPFPLQHSRALRLLKGKERICKYLPKWELLSRFKLDLCASSILNVRPTEPTRPPGSFGAFSSSRQSTGILLWPIWNCTELVGGGTFKLLKSIPIHNAKANPKITCNNLCNFKTFATISISPLDILGDHLHIEDARRLSESYLTKCYKMQILFARNWIRTLGALPSHRPLKRHLLDPMTKCLEPVPWLQLRYGLGHLRGSFYELFIVVSCSSSSFSAHFLYNKLRNYYDYAKIFQTQHALQWLPATWRTSSPVPVFLVCWHVGD